MMISTAPEIQAKRKSFSNTKTAVMIATLITGSVMSRMIPIPRHRSEIVITL